MRYLLLLCVLGVLISPGVSHAQFLDTINQGQVVAEPRFPDPYSEARLTLQAYTLDLSSYRIQWFLDGTEERTFENEYSLTFTTGAVGEVHRIVVLLTSPQGETIRLTEEVPVTLVDIIIEGDVFVPPFYRGRALPGAGSVARAVALPYRGGSIDYANLSYRWKLNGTALGGGTRLGGNVIEFTMPTSRDAVLTVEITDRMGGMVTTKHIVLTPPESQIVFYEDNELRGLKRVALKDPHIFVGDEMRIHAEPYYLNSFLLGGARSMLSRWLIDGEEVNTNVSNFPHTIQLQRSGAGSASLEYELRNLENFVEGAKGTLRLNF